MCYYLSGAWVTLKCITRTYAAVIVFMFTRDIDLGLFLLLAALSRSGLTSSQVRRIALIVGRVSSLTIYTNGTLEFMNSIN